MQKRLLIIDGQSDMGGPNVTVGQAKAVVGTLFGEIQRLEFRNPKQLIADLPKYQADRVMTAGHGGHDGPNASSAAVISSRMKVTPLGIDLKLESQDQLTTIEQMKASLSGPNLLCEVNNHLAVYEGREPIGPGNYTDPALIQAVFYALSDLSAAGMEGITVHNFDWAEPTSNTDNLPAFADFCRALASCVGSPIEQQGQPLEPYFYVGSCYSRANWNGGEVPEEPASFAHAVAGLSGVPTFANVNGTSVSATLENIKRIEHAVDASPTGKVPNNAKLQDGVKLVR